MLLGVNFVRGSREAITFNGDALRALRPAIVRHVLTEPHNVAPWVEEARRRQVKVLWCVPFELTGFHAAKYAIRTLAHLAGDVSAGLELGDRGWNGMWAAAHFLEYAHGLSLEAAGALGPVYLGAGVTGDRATTKFMLALLHQAQPTRRGDYAGVTCHAIRPGRRFRRFKFASFAHHVGERFGCPLAFTRVGWQLGETLGAWAALLETIRAFGQEGMDTKERSVVSAELRRRWTLEAFDCAHFLGARLFLLDTCRVREDGINSWAFYDSITGRADPTWFALQWRLARLELLEEEIDAPDNSPLPAA